MSEEIRKLFATTEPEEPQFSVPTDEEIDAALATDPNEYPDIQLAPTPPVVETPATEPVPEETTETPDFQKSRVGALTAMAATAADTTLPAIGGLASFPVGAAGVGLVAAPTGPVAIGAAVTGGILASAAGYWATDTAQDAAFQYVAPESYEKWQAYLKQAKQDYPLSTSVGQLAPNLIAMRPDIGAAKQAVSFGRQLLSRQSVDLTSSIGKAQIENLANVVFGGGTEFAAEAVRQATEEGNFDFMRLAAMTLFGSLLNKQTKLGTKLTNIAGFNQREVPLEPVVTETDEQLAELLIRELGGEAAATPTPNAIREKYNSLEEFIQSDFPDTGMADDSLVADMLRLRAKTTQAEKTSHFTSWTPKEKLAYDQGDYETFSRLRGYTESEIADFKKYQKLREEVANKYGQEIMDSFDHPDVSEFVYDLEFGAGSYAKKQERLSDIANPDLSPTSGENPPSPRISEAVKRQNEEAALQLREFAKLINEDISGDISEKAAQAGTLNVDILNAAITRNPEREIQSLAITLRDDLKVPRLTAEKRANDAAEWLASHGYEERVQALRNSAQATDEINYQIIAARYMTEQAIGALRKAEEKLRNTNTEESLAEAISTFLEVKRVLKPAEKIRGNWGRMGHAFRALRPDQKNIMTINKMLQKAGIDDFQNLTKDKAEQMMKLISLALQSNDPKAFARIANMTSMDIAVGALSEVATGAVMSFVDTGIVTLVGGVAESVLTPVNGTLSGAMGIVSNAIKKRSGKATDSDIKRELDTMKAYASYYKHLLTRFRANAKVMLSVMKDNEPRFGEGSTQLESVRGGMPVERGQRIEDPNTFGKKVASKVYGNVGKFRSRGWITSETMGIDPNKNPFGAIIVDAIGEVFRFSHRSILAADELVKGSNAYAAAHTKLYMEGAEKGLSGTNLEKYISERVDLLMDRNNTLYSEQRIAAEISKEVQAEGFTGAETAVETLKRTKEKYNTEMGELGKFAEDWVKLITYQSDMGARLNGTPTYGKSIETWFRAHPVTRVILGQYFIRTPVNLFRMTGRYIPTAPLIDMVSSVKIKGDKPFVGLKNIQKEYYESFMSGDQFRISQARGRMLTGTALAGTAFYFAANGLTTGALSANKEQRKLQLSKGYIPYAFKIRKGSNVAAEIEKGVAQNPDMKWDSETDEHYLFEFKRIHEPTSAIFMVVSDLAQLMKSTDYNDRDVSDIFGMTTMVIGDQISEKVFLNNIKQWMDLFTGIQEDRRDIGRKISTYIGRRVSPLVMPVSESTDPVIYDLSSFTQQIARRMPESLRNNVFGEAMYLPKSYNILGEAIDSATTGIPLVDSLNPFYVSSTKRDPVIEEMLSFNYNFSSPEKFYGTESGRGWDIRGFVYKGGSFTQLAADVDDERVFTKKALETFLSQPELQENEKELAEIYRKNGITKLPKLGQDAYDRWQENIGQIKLGGFSLRDALAVRIKSKKYQSLENDIFQGEENPRAKELMTIIGQYRSAALLLTKLEYPELNKAITVKKVTNRALKMGVQREDIKKIPSKVEEVLNFPN